MDYKTTVEKIFSFGARKDRKTSLETISRMSSLLGNPQHSFKAVHIAGTNGKGSTAVKIAAALYCDGYSVGTFTSPHISCYRERIVVDGAKISEDDVVTIASKILTVCEENNIEPTFFEITTALALYYFAMKNIDIAVIEAGIGGRLDPTNVITPILSVITSISIDHTAYLGNTIADIAYEKAGIIKAKTSLVLGPKALSMGIQDIAKKIEAPVIEVVGNYNDVEEENNAIAQKALEELKISMTSIKKGLKATLPCRFDIKDVDGVTVVFDIAHNPDGFQRLFKTLHRSYPERSIRAVVGLSADKDIKQCMKVVAENTCALYLVAGNNSRCVTTKTLKAVADEYAVTIERQHPTIAETMQHAITSARKHNDIVVVCGSCYIMEEPFNSV
ncbi:MAG: bifunctional folylpolyglutamate synthase/dihydrofolate synthase [Waddliaceae bacterium]|nr:bifunctional folylpolyglutamate synthase/dihydrofolate synthase [Waddliaceae bacterium]MBT3578783.1 bifunctional folylpolyglutamate synthase/dihydrofolate synthase [Waddliaceae bacterium]MBT4445318.1 bifunctional folylpolyglutamate synthase/dihydrofolate synthase [Waddliaceae bacterium]MBT6928614.1 bifunctional folylpolyglutamate synthase/dihydrofolate synthase [Waddliaceae bacterium]MBT7265122.1 bifunctional folylpolyglutamate synthase/dihydrofolate synthase [Waddliaceae bacterium]